MNFNKFFLTRQFLIQHTIFQVNSELTLASLPLQHEIMPADLSKSSYSHLFKTH